MRSLLFLLLFVSSFINAQINNLVPNPSFEDTVHCPNTISQISLSEYWFLPPSNYPSSEYYNTCCQACVVDVPSNFIGYQEPKSGEGYAGIVCYCTSACIPSTNYREYIEAKLLLPLSTGKNYCVSIYVSLANNSRYAIERIGVYFSNDSILSNDNYVLPFYPQISGDTNIIISDTSEWVLIEGGFYANGGENFITIGNFNNDTNVSFEEVNTTNLDYFAYYYIDDISVYLCDDTIPKPEELKIPNVFTPGNDNANETFFIENLPEQSHLIIYNRWGQSVLDKNNYLNNWDAYDLGAGVYYYVLSLPNGEKKKGFVEVIK